MRIKFLGGLFLATSVLATVSIGVMAQQQQGLNPYGGNIFTWWSDVPHSPGVHHVASSIVELSGTGGIKVIAGHQHGGITNGKYLVYIDGSGIAKSAQAARTQSQ